MAKTIVQKVVFKNATPQQLYQLYMDPKKHTAATATATKIQDKEGTNFSAGDGYMWGKNLRLVKNQLIVQTWKAVDWSKDDLDSVLILRFEPKGKDTVLHVTHANVPDNQAKGIDDGWRTFYWEPWKKYLAGTPIAKSAAM